MLFQVTISLSRYVSPFYSKEERGRRYTIRKQRIPPFGGKGGGGSIGD